VLRNGAARSIEVARSAKLSTSSNAGDAPMMTGEKAAAATPDSAISALMSSVREPALERWRTS
jgi:hypothetical protein